MFDFQQFAQTNNLALAYLLYGENLAASLKIAKSLAYYLETKESNQPLLDCLLLNSSGASIGIDEIRRLKEFLMRRPVLSSRRLVIIQFADLLTQEAQNALLKITEDGPSSALIILLAKRRDSLLSTLLSRLNPVFVPSGASESDQDQNLNFFDNLAHSFLASFNPRSLINDLVERDKADRPHDAVFLFLDCLIKILAQNPLKNSSRLKLVLTAKADLKEYNLNKKLRLYALHEALKS